MDHSSELCFLLPPASCSTGGSLLPIAPGVVVLLLVLYMYMRM
jgi:hypothetical protein